MRRGSAVVAAVVLLGAGGCTDDAGGDGAAPSSTTAGGARPDTAWIADTDDDALFTVDCDFSHRAADDPIVSPGQPGASHSHEFFGSVATDASSTGDGLRGTETTCEDTEDTASYWTPTLSVAGTPVEPSLLRAYYRARPGVDVRDVTPPPLGLAMITGDPDRGGGAGHDHGAATPAGHDHGTSDAEVAAEDPTADAGWGCGLRPRAFHVEPPTDCTARSPLTLRLRFPDCWDGERLDSPDHRAHVTRSVDGECPDGHPVLMTELQVSISWPVTGGDAADATLSSGGVAGAHGDFLNGWEPDALADHVELCIHAEANCTIG